MSERKLLCRSRTFMGNDAVFLTPTGLDVDAGEHYEVVRRRVFFDDVHLVTLHVERGLAFLISTGLWGGFWVALAVFILALNVEAWAVALVFLGIGGLPFLAFLIRLAMGRPVVTVYGRRSKAVLRFGSFGKTRARNAYGQICAAVRRAQASEAVNAPGSTERPLPPDVPLPPPAQSHFPPQ